MTQNSQTVLLQRLLWIGGCEETNYEDAIRITIFGSGCVGLVTGAYFVNVGNDVVFLQIALNFLLSMVRCVASPSTFQGLYGRGQKGSLKGNSGCSRRGGCVKCRIGSIRSIAQLVRAPS